MKRKLLLPLLILALVLCVCALASCNSAKKNNDPVAPGELAYTLSSDGTYYSVSGIGTCTSTNIVIPSTYNGLPVKEISERAFLSVNSGVTIMDLFETCQNFTSVTIPDSVTSIGLGAFDGCSSLTSVTFGENSQLTSIGRSAFEGCNSLTSITIPAGVTDIGDWAFSGCYKLVEVYNKSSLTITAESEDNGYVGYHAKAVYTEPYTSKLSTDSDGYIIYTDGKDKILVGYTGTDTMLTLPSGITEINQCAFYSCRSLTSVTIPDSVTNIGDEAFYGCFKLIEVYNKSSLKISSTGFFRDNGCVGSYAKNIYTVKGGSKLSTDKNGYIIYTDGKDKILVGYTGTGTKLTLPDGITEINQDAFYDYSSLTSITIPNSVTSIDNFAFYKCSSLTSITIPDSVTDIDYGAFAACCSLISVTIGNGVTDIAYNAFKYCCKLIEVYNKSSLEITAGSSNNGCVGLYAKAVYTEPYTSKLSTDKNGYIVYTDGKDKILVGYTGTSTELILPDGITEINQCAFIACNSLTSITIPDSVTSIGSNAFLACNSLTSITIPDSVTSIDEYAFLNCNSLTSVTFGSGSQLTSIGEDAFYNTAWYNNQPDGVVYTGKVLYEYKGTMPDNTSIVIKEGTVKIQGGVFSGCTGLTSITIPDSVTSIGSAAFSGCRSLTCITFGGNSQLTNIGSNTFKGCSSLTSITIPDSVTSIGYGAFWECSNLTSITIPNSVTSIGNDAFWWCYKLIEVYNKSSLNITAGSSGDGCVGLYAKAVYTKPYTSKLSTDKNGFIYYADGAERILVGYTGTSTELTLPDGITKIYKYAFYNRDLQNITIPDSVISIGEDAFYNTAWYNNQPDGLVYAGKVLYAYKGTIEETTSLLIKEGTLGIADSAFYHANGPSMILDGQITIPDSVISIGKYAFYPFLPINIYYEGDIAGWCSISGLDNIIFEATLFYPIKDTAEDELPFALYIGGSKVAGDLVIPDGATSIPALAFVGCNELTSITIPDSVTSIGYGAFAYCSSLESITIPFVGVNKEENTHFGYIFGRDSDYVPSSLKSVVITGGTSIGNYAFEDCSSLTSITIPDSVTSIGNYAFSYCSSLTSVTIGSGVTSIGYYAFEDCDSLTTIYYTGTEEEWNALTKNTDLGSGIGDYTIVYNYTGE